MNRTNSSVPVIRDTAAVVPQLFIHTAIVFGTMVCVTSLIAILVLFKCKKIVEQIRLTSIHLCVANFGYGLTMVTNGMYYLITSTICGSIFKSIPFFCLLYFMFLTFTGIDRLLSLTLSIRYKFWSRKRNMYIVATAVYVLAACMGIIPNIPQNGFFKCEGSSSEMFLFSGLVSFVSTMLLLITIHFLCFICIGYLVLKKTLPGPFEKGTDYTKYWTVTKQVVKLGITSILFVTPYLVTRVQDVVNFRDNVLHGNTSIATYVSTSIMFAHQFISPLLILFGYHECRFVALNAILCCFPSLKQRIQQEYREYYCTYAINTM